MQAFDLLELRDDLSRESRRLEKLVGGLIAMTPAGIPSCCASVR